MEQTASRTQDLGSSLRYWRMRRKLSQMELSGDAEISTRHLSFIETGRSAPSRETLERLCGELALSLRERNRLFLKAGYAPPFAEKPLEDSLLSSSRAALDQVLVSMEPNPALVLDRHWNLISCNRAVPRLLEGVSSALLEPPVNVLRLSFHPEGLAPRIVNRAQWQKHLLERARIQISTTDDVVLRNLISEISPWASSSRDHTPLHESEYPFVPLQLRVGSEVMSFVSTTMVFGSPLEVTLSELAIECFFPADAQTKKFLAS